MIMKRWYAALAASLMSICGVAAPASARIITVRYVVPSTKNIATIVFEATQRGVSNVYDLTGVYNFFVNGAAVATQPFYVGSLDAIAGGNPATTPTLALDGSFLDFRIGDSYGNTFYAGVNNKYSTISKYGDVTYISSDYGGENQAASFVPDNFRAKLGAPGAPAPLLGLGLLPALAGAGGLAATRRRRKSALSPAFA